MKTLHQLMDTKVQELLKCLEALGGASIEDSTRKVRERPWLNRALMMKHNKILNK